MWYIVLDAIVDRIVAIGVAAADGIADGMTSVLHSHQPMPACMCAISRLYFTRDLLLALCYISFVFGVAGDNRVTHSTRKTTTNDFIICFARVLVSLHVSLLLFANTVSS